MLNRASQSPIPPLNTNVGVAAAVVTVIVEGTALISRAGKEPSRKARHAQFD